MGGAMANTEFENTSETPVVSIICTCYNKGPWIQQALASIASQKTEFATELIVVDDASTDGSVAAITSFLDSYAGIYQLVLHKDNVGITKTWLEACSMAKGRYIARLDGDDYWTDESKIGTQVEALEQSECSRWCCTDFDLVDSNGELIHESVIKSGYIESIDSYEQLLATKGATNSSTWVVEKQLLDVANESLVEDVADDTFSLQLEMFRATKLLRIEQSMCALRSSSNSDSRPGTSAGMKKRLDGLERQQLQYLAKYTDADYREVARRSIQHDMKHELLIFELQQAIRRQTDLIQEREDEIERLKNSRNFLRPMKNAFNSLVKHPQRRP